MKNMDNLRYKDYYEKVRYAIKNKETIFKINDQEINVGVLDIIGNFIFNYSLVFTILLIILLPLAWYYEFLLVATIVLIIPYLCLYIGYSRIK